MADRARRPGESGDPATFPRMALDSRGRGNDGIAPGRLRRFFEPSSRVLAMTVVVSLAAHLTIAALPQPTVSAPEAMPVLSATITEMPPPPTPPVARPVVKRKAKPSPARVAAAPAAAPEAPIPTVEAEAWPTTEDDVPVAKAEP